MAKDPYKYFRVEAREVLEGLSQGALDLEKGSGGIELVVRMLRLAHTLKGAARVVGQARIADLAHAIEDVLTPYRTDGGAAMAADEVRRLLPLIDEIGRCIPGLPEAGDPIASRAATAEPLKNVRIEIGEMDALLAGLLETDAHLTAVRTDVRDLGAASAMAAALVKMLPEGTRTRDTAEALLQAIERSGRGLSVGLDHVDHEIAQVREQAHELRLVPASAVFGELERAVRDAALAVDHPVRWESSGGEHRLEANVLYAVRDALTHVVRNAVAHGIEPAAERRSAGKPPAGVVRLDVERRGQRIAFVCRDDGRGIDVEAVRRAAVRRGLVSATDQFAPDELVQLALHSGVTTSTEVTQVAGRGIGLDVLRATAGQLKGEVQLSSARGRGTTVDLCVPVSLSSVPALVVETSGHTLSLPLDAVKRTLRLAEGDIARSAERDSVVVDGAVIPFVPLGRLLGRATTARAWSTVVVRHGARSAAIGVDRLIGTANIVLRSLPKLAGPAPLVAGASLDASGDPQLVLDPAGVVDAAYARPGTLVVDHTPPARAPVLIIDDSLTTRMLEQSILESAGYAVDLAVSAEEGLVKARNTTYGLFLVDVEMPGMSGFEFVAHTRGDPTLRTVPAILVTSRQSPEDRQRGAEAGAHAYIVKGEFDQGQLLRTIGQLLG